MIVKTEFDEWGQPVFKEAGPKGQTLVMGGDGMYGKWGYGEDLVKAKAEFRKAGGRLGLGYTIFQFDAETEFFGVTNMGGYYFKGNPPKETAVPPTKTAAKR